MATEKIQVLIEGGKATAAPPLGPALGPMGVNIGQVVADINKKTTEFKNMQVPVTVSIETDTKEYSISIGTPPAAALVKKEAQVDKGSSRPGSENMADLLIEQIIKIAKMKEDALLGKSLKEKVREIVGTCNSMGILVEGKPGVETLKDIAAGKFDQKIAEEKTELTDEELKRLEEERKEMAAEIAKKREKHTKAAKEIVEELKGKDAKEIRKAMADAGIPEDIIKEHAPEEPAAAGEQKK